MSTAKWRSPLWESNPRPFPYHGNALPTELRGRDPRSPSRLVMLSAQKSHAPRPSTTSFVSVSFPLEPAHLEPTVILREATVADAPAIAAIYNHEVTSTVATFDLVPRTLDDQVAWINARSGAFSAVVAVNKDQEVLGFGSLSPYKERAAYRTSVEDSVYVDRSLARRGIGRLILNHLLEIAENSGFHAVFARIEASGAASRALHEKCGFRLVGVESEVGRKFNRWLDVAVMECLLHERPRA
jgi:L-amino acid N-acyltransferase YncA